MTYPSFSDLVHFNFKNLVTKIYFQNFFDYLHSAFQVLVNLLYLAAVSPSFYLETEILNIISWNLFQNY